MLRTLGLVFATVLAAGSVLAADERYDATVWADVEIDDTGRAIAVEFPGKVAGSALADNLRKQIQSWQFEPAKHDGNPVAAKTSLELTLDVDARGSQATVKVKEALPAPRPVKSDAPKYPPEALRAHAAGEVWVEFSVNADGTVSDVSAKAPKVDKRLVQAAIDSVSTWRFKPEVVDGIPAATRAGTSIAFWLGGPNQRPPSKYPGGLRRSLDGLGSDAIVAESHVKLKTDLSAAM